MDIHVYCAKYIKHLKRFFVIEIGSINLNRIVYIYWLLSLFNDL